MLSTNADVAMGQLSGTANTTGTLRRGLQGPLFAVVLVFFAWVFLANSWVGDDAYITFRVSDNLIHGFGPRWNVAERVQAYTNPLWMFVMAGGAAVTGEFYCTSLAISFLCCAAVFVVLRRRLRTGLGFGLAAALLCSSKAFVDYTSSGLEYPLSYLLLAAFAATALSSDGSPRTEAPRRVVWMTVLAALAFVNRADTVLLYGPLLAYCLWAAVRNKQWAAVGGLAAATAPAVLWLLFALVYYGFPFPNTYYAKVATGLPTAIRLHQGLAYVTNSIRYDPITLGVVGIAVLIGSWWRSPARFGLVAGAGLYVLYSAWVGGDFMAGRFFALPFLSAVIVITWDAGRRLGMSAAIAGLAVLTVINPLAPIKTGATYEMGWPWRTQNGIKDERGGYHKSTNILFAAPFRPLPDYGWVREGRSLAASADTVFVRPSIGFLGFYAGPSKYIVDANALSDPLLARLPVGWELYFEFWASHFSRPIPQGYVESRRRGKNEITDPSLKPYFEKLLNVTTGPLFSVSRWRDIVDLNVGSSRDFHNTFRATQLVDADIRAGNPRFQSDVGDVDRDQFVHTTGRAGFLLMGPKLPLPAGRYEIGWVGDISADGTAADLGFVQVCYEDCRKVLAEAWIRAEDGGVLPGALPVMAPEGVSDVEFRLFVNEGVKAMLRHVTVKQRR